MRHWYSGILAIIVLLASSSVAFANFEQFTYSPYVYRIKISGCKPGVKDKEQTGFRVKSPELKGIVTALHGVQDCTVINAEPEPGSGATGPFNNLVIEKIDPDRDLVLLSSKELLELNTAGLVPETSMNEDRFEGVVVIGYPQAINSQIPTEVVIPQRTQLINLMTAESVTVIKNNTSPNLQINVLHVSGGHLLPGHSGAPLINQSGHLIGVGNGGLEDGHIEIGWAIPWEEIEWQLVEKGETTKSIETVPDRNPLIDFSNSASKKNDAMVNDSSRELNNGAAGNTDDLLDEAPYEGGLAGSQKEIFTLVNKLHDTTDEAEKEEIRADIDAIRKVIAKNIKISFRPMG